LKVVSRLFIEKDFECKYLVNIGADDEFGDNFLNKYVYAIKYLLISHQKSQC